uniref:CUB domain-containing protein n=1 Tax=Oryctolagus cuniculus TaxID=9986 RepID=A0A5F9CDK0_RABIT
MQRIRLQLPALGLTCPDEHVEILDGFVLSESLGKICQGSALLYQSTSNVVTVKYTRIPSRQPTPFEALYSSVSAEPDELQARAGGPAQCVGLFTRSSGRLVKHARGQRGCVWIIRVQPSYLVHLSFPLLRLDCKQERVEILDGYPGSVSLGTACTGSSLAYLSSSNTMTVIYNSTSNYSPTFFDAYYHSDLKETETCGGHLTDLWGRLIHLPGYKASCVWVIKVKPGRRVSLAFPALNLTCENEHVEILAGTPDATSLGRICQGFSLVYQSNSNTMTVKYSTKRSGPSSFFEAYYYSDPEEVPTLPEGSDPRECENHFIDLWGRSTLSRTRTSPCIWTLVIKPTQRGNQHASFLNLTCDSEQWEILDKPFGSNSLGTICQTMSLAYQTSLNRMTLSYSSRSSPQPTLFDVHLFGESPETIESIRKKGKSGVIMSPHSFPRIENVPYFKKKRKIYLFYVKVRVTHTEKERQRERERERGLPSTGSLPSWLQWLELRQSEARSFFLVSHAGAGAQGHGPSSTAFPGHSRELDGKWSSQDLNWRPYEMLVLQAVALRPTMSQHQP